MAGSRIALVWLVLAAVAALGAPAAGAARPNVLLIISDDQSIADPMSVMPRTTRLFAARGRSFTRAYVTTPLCCPSRASIFSGLYAHNHGVIDADGKRFRARRSWQRLLHNSGYRTGIAGKYLNRVSTDTAPHFDHTRVIATEDPSASRKLARFAAGFIRRGARRPRPWALVLGAHAPHLPFTEKPLARRPIPPYAPPPPEGDLSDKDPSVAAAARFYADRGFTANAPRLWKPRLRELQALDEAVDKVFRALRRSGEGRRTLAIFISDNGFLWGEHRLFFKLWPYRESVEVPMFVRWPGHVRRGGRDHRLVANIDIAPTILAAAGIKRHYATDGISLLSSKKRSALLTELPKGLSSPAWGTVPAWHALITRDRFHIEWEGGHLERYDLRSDPHLRRARNSGGAAASKLVQRLKRCSGRTCKVVSR